MDKATRKNLTALILQLILPCNILISFVSQQNVGLLRDCVWILILAMVLQVLLHWFSKCLFRKTEVGKQSCLRYGLICSNATFLGLPVIESVFGAEGVMYAAIAILPLRIVMWTEGLTLFCGTHQNGAWKKILLNPCILAVLVGLLFMLAPMKMPAVLYQSTQMLSRCTSAMVMLIIGAMLSEIPIRNVFNPLTLQYSFWRLIFIPACILIMGRLLHCDTVILGVLVIMQGMPMATTGVMLAAQYSDSSDFASEMMFTSTLLSMVTIPLLLIFLA